MKDTRAADRAQSKNPARERGFFILQV
jgi:hypothetical protein